MSVPEEVYGRALIYTCIYFGGIWSMVLYNMAAGILRAYGDSKRPLYVLICCAVINIVGDLVLVGVLQEPPGDAGPCCYRECSEHMAPFRRDKWWAPA